MKDIFALDLGSSKISLARLSKGDSCEQIDILETRSEGVKKGVLADFSKLTLNIFELVSQFEGKHNCEVKDVYVGITGHHLSVTDAQVKLSLNDNVLTDSKYQQWHERVRQSFVDERHHVLFNWLSSYSFDGRDHVENPIGMSGRELRARAGAVICTRSYAKDVMRACNEAGLKVLGLFPESLATALATTSQAERDLGVAVVDIGHGSTDGIVFSDGFPIKAFMVAKGGAEFNANIAKKLVLSELEAEKIKVYFGMTNQEDSKHQVSVMNLYNEPVDVDASMIYETLRATSRSICEGVFKELSSERKKFPFGIVISGGTSQLKGISEDWAKLLKVKVQSRQPTVFEPSALLLSSSNMDEFGNLTNIEHYSTEAKFSTILGMLFMARYRVAASEQGTTASSPSFFSKKIFSTISSWIRDMQS